MASESVMRDLGHYHSGGAQVWFDQACLHSDQDPLAWFDPDNEQIDARHVTVGGRQAAWFVTVQGQQAVLRHYRRGGLVARLSRDRYFWTGQRSTRSLSEFLLMRDLRLLGLPVPAPLAAAAWREGFTYRAAILVARIPGVRTLAVCDDPFAWQQAGQTVAAMHAQGVWHADLNVHNILIDSANKAWLIDFDRGRRFSHLSEQKRHGNLQRLHRSILKVLPEKAPIFWSSFVQAYSSAITKKNYHHH
jgi:3-deoxy-D-manno-octulosonic acid kinase